MLNHAVIDFAKSSRPSSLRRPYPLSLIINCAKRWTQQTQLELPSICWET